MKVIELLEAKEQQAGKTLDALKADLRLSKPVQYGPHQKKSGLVLIPVPTNITYDELEFFKQMAHIALKKHMGQLNPQPNPDFWKQGAYLTTSALDDLTKFKVHEKIRPNRVLAFKVDKL